MDYTEVINLNISDPTVKAQVISILTQISSTPDGQMLLSKIQQGAGNIDITFGTSVNSIYDADGKFININMDQLETTTTLMASSSQYETVSLNRLLVHEMFHAAEAHLNPEYIPDSDGKIENLSALEIHAVHYTNSFMDKYYSEDSRFSYTSQYTKLNQPKNDVPFYNSLNPNLNFEVKG